MISVLNGVLNGVPSEFREPRKPIKALGFVSQDDPAPIVNGCELLEAIEVTGRDAIIDATVTHWSALNISGHVVYPDGSPASGAGLTGGSRSAYELNGLTPGSFAVFTYTGDAQ